MLRSVSVTLQACGSPYAAILFILGHDSSPDPFFSVFCSEGGQWVLPSVPFSKDTSGRKRGCREARCHPEPCRVGCRGPKAGQEQPGHLLHVLTSMLRLGLKGNEKELGGGRASPRARSSRPSELVTRAASTTRGTT